jgi:hypothetical protein
MNRAEPPQHPLRVLVLAVHNDISVQNDILNLYGNPIQNRKIKHFLTTSNTTPHLYLTDIKSNRISL